MLGFMVMMFVVQKSMFAITSIAERTDDVCFSPISINPDDVRAKEFLL
jgi:hypothetical protein